MTRLRAIPALHRAAHAVGLFVATIPGAPVNQAEAHVLVYLDEQGASRINAIHAAFGHRRSTLTSILDRLEKAKLIKRTMDHDDRRSVLVSLTAAGERLGGRVSRVMRDAEASALRPFSDAEIAVFSRICDALRKI